VRRLTLLLVVLAACSRAVSSSGGSATTGAAAPRLAVEQFLAAVRAQDLQAMSVAWGNEKGPGRDQFDRTELEKRLIVMQSCTDHEKFRIVSEAPGDAGQRIFRVELTKGPVTATPRVWATRGPSERWYVSNLDMDAVTQICRQG
jgi:hypothetical protein